MTYATQQDMEDEFGTAELIQLTDTTKSGTIDTAVLGNALEKADNEINSKLGARFTTPLATVPPKVVDIARDLARYYLYRQQPTPIVEARFNTAIRQLEAARDGKETLGIAPTEPPSSGGDSYLASEAYERAMTPSTLADYI